MPGRREHDTAVGHTFALEVDGQRVTMLTEVNGLALEHEVVELREGGAGGSAATRSMPGRRRSGEVTLTRGLTADRTFEQWARDASLAPPLHAVGTVHLVVLDRQGRPVITYALNHAWPRRLEIDGLKTGATEGLTERLVLVYESFERV